MLAQREMTDLRAPGSEVAPLRNGPAAAAILAGGVGSAFYGLMVVLVEASAGIKSALTWWNPAGPLTGKTGMGVIGFLVAWYLLARAWKGRDVNLDKVWKVTLALIVVGLIFTFPPFFTLFASH